MKRIVSIATIFTLIAGVMFVAPVLLAVDGDVSTYAASEASPIVAVSTPKNVKVVKKSATSLKISWSKVTGVKGYVVYRYDSKAKKYKAVKTLKGVSKTSWVNKKLKTNKTYKYKVATYKQVSGKKKYSKLSYVVSARPYAKGAKTANVAKIIISDRYNAYTKRYLGLKAVTLIPMEVKVSGKNVKPLNKKIRWFSSNTKLVKVNKKGLIRAQGKAGTCYVYARAHNGVTKKIKVTIKDYANPKSFKNLDKVKKFDKRMPTILAAHKEDFCDIVSFLESVSVPVRLVYDLGHLQIVSHGVEPSDDLWDRMEKLFKDEDIGVNSNAGYVMFEFPNAATASHGISTLIYTDCNEADDPKNGSIKIAPCWYYYFGHGV